MHSCKIFARRERRLSDSMQTPNTVRIGLIDASITCHDRLSWRIQFNPRATKPTRDPRCFTERSVSLLSGKRLSLLQRITIYSITFTDVLQLSIFPGSSSTSSRRNWVTYKWGTGSYARWMKWPASGKSNPREAGYQLTATRRLICLDAIQTKIDKFALAES